MKAVTLAALIASLVWTSGLAAEPGPIRNVLFLLSDDHAAYALGSYGNSVVRTPNLDRP